MIPAAVFLVVISVMFPGRHTRSLLASGAVLLVLASIGIAQACQICIPFPQKSAADFLLEADAIVLAREDPSRPFHFAPVEVLRGEPGDEPIDLFLNSATRRLLATHPERSIILARTDTGGKTSWQQVGTADELMKPVVLSILEAAPSWEDDPGARATFFATWLGHENAQLRELAHLEVARAPYREIRNCAGHLSREEIHEFLANVRYAEWHPLYILLLAQSADPGDRQRIVESFDSAARFGTTLRLAAWTTALVEIREDEAIESIEELYFRNPSRKPEELLAVLQALSVHGSNGHVHLRDRIIESYRVVLEHHPRMVPQVVGDLSSWRRNDLSAEVAELISSDTLQLDFSSLLKARAYARKSGLGAGNFKR